MTGARVQQELGKKHPFDSPVQEARSSATGPTSVETVSFQTTAWKATSTATGWSTGRISPSSSPHGADHQLPQSTSGSKPLTRNRINTISAGAEHELASNQYECDQLVCKVLISQNRCRRFDPFHTCSSARGGVNYCSKRLNFGDHSERKHPGHATGHPGRPRCPVKGFNVRSGPLRLRLVACASRDHRSRAAQGRPERG